MGTKKFIADEGIQVDNVQIGVSGTGEIDTSTGNLTIDSAGGTVTIDDNLTVTGDFTVSGSVTTINTETLTVNDNLIVLNNNVTGSPTENAGVEVERGTSANVAIRWNETSDKWEITEDGTTYDNIATESYAESLTPTSIDDIGDVNITSAASGDFLKWNGSAWVNDTIDLGTDTTGNYVADVVAGTGITVTHTPGEGSSASVALNAALNDLTDVSAASPSNGEFLKYVSASSAWVPAAIPTINALDDIGDVSASAPTTGHFLKWDGSAWVPAAAGGAVTTTTISTNSETTVATFSKTAAESAEFIVKVKQGERRYSDKVLVLHNGTTADFTDFAELSLSAAEVAPGTGATTWVTRTSNFGGTSIIYSVAFGNNLWVAGGYGQIRTSTDAITWVTRTSNFGTTNIRSVAFGNNLWVAGGYTGNIRTSTDAITWVTRTSNFGNRQIYSVAFGNNLWAAGGYYGELRTSTDAVTWVTRTSNFTNNIFGNINSIAFGNNLWVAGGNFGQLRTSTDAITWVTQISNFSAGFNGNIRSVAFGNSLWVAGGYGGQIRTSTDAVTWVTRTSNLPTNFSGEINSFAFGNSLWVAGGYGGRIRTSTDAITWVTRESNFTTTIQSVAFGNSLWVAGGYSGQIRTSAADTNSVHVGGSTSSASVSFNADISGSDVRLRMTIPDAATTAATVKVLATTVGES